MEVENGTCRFIGTSKFSVQVSVALRLELFSECKLGRKRGIVALACKLFKNSKIIYGFSIQECMKLIKIAVDTNQI